MLGITPYDSFEPYSKKNYDLFNTFKDFEKNFFGSDFGLCDCKTDIREEKDKYILDAELPGFDKNDIKLDINGNNLIISAEHSSENEEKDKKGRYIRRERSYGSYSRSYDISGVDSDKFEAEYKSGVLKLILPKKAISETSAKRIEIK